MWVLVIRILDLGFGIFGVVDTGLAMLVKII